MRRHLPPLLLVGTLGLGLLAGPVAAQPVPASAPAGHPGAAPAAPAAPAPAAPAAPAPAARAPAANAPAAPAAADVRAPADSGFTPIGPGESAAPPDTLTAPTLVKAAYSLIWLAVVVFLVSLWRRQRRLGDEVAALRARLDRNPEGN
jgi:hypothetical protein